MKGSAVIPILLAVVVPLLVLGLLVSASGLDLIQWRPPVLWTDEFGAGAHDSGVTALKADTNGFYMGGYLDTGGIPFGGTSFLRKYDDNGGIAWTLNVSDTGELLVSGIGVGAGGTYVGGGANNLTILKFDPSGNRLWSRSVGFSSEFGGLFAASSNVYVAGRSNHPLTNQTFVGSVLFLRKYDPNGSVVWTSEFSNASSLPGAVEGVYVSTTTVFVLTDGPLVGYDLIGNQLWSDPIGVSLLIVPYSIAGDGTSVYVTGIARPGTLSRAHGFLTKFDAKGNVVWNVLFDSPDLSGVGESSVWTDSSGVYVTFVSTDSNGFVSKYDFNGAQEWNFKTPVAPAQGYAGMSFLGTAVQGGFALGGAFVHPGGPRITGGIVQRFSGSSSLIFFGLNPPWSFIVLGGLLCGCGVSVLFSRKLRRKRMRPKRLGPSPSTLPTTD